MNDETIPSLQLLTSILQGAPQRPEAVANTQLRRVDLSIGPLHRPGTLVHQRWRVPEGLDGTTPIGEGCAELSSRTVPEKPDVLIAGILDVEPIRQLSPLLALAGQLQLVSAAWDAQLGSLAVWIVQPDSSLNHQKRAPWLRKAGFEEVFPNESFRMTPFIVDLAGTTTYVHLGDRHLTRLGQLPPSPSTFEGRWVALVETAVARLPGPVFHQWYEDPAADRDFIASAVREHPRAEDAGILGRLEVLINDVAADSDPRS